MREVNERYNKWWNHIFWSLFIRGLILIVLGILALRNPATTYSIIATILPWLLIIMGIVNIIQFIQKKRELNKIDDDDILGQFYERNRLGSEYIDLIVGIVCLILGIILLKNPILNNTILVVLFAVAIFAIFLRAIYALPSLSLLNPALPWISLILSILGMICCFQLIFAVSLDPALIGKIIGWVLIIAGIIDVIYSFTTESYKQDLSDSGK